VSRFFLFILVLMLVVLGAVLAWWALSLPGEVTFPIGSDVVSIRTGIAIFLLFVLGGLIALVWWLATGLLILPGRISRSRRLSKARKANAALAEGLLAAEGGDAKSALKLARKAMRHAEDERLKLLLEARAAEANDDWAGAERAWGLLTRLPGGQLAGLRGAAAAASERGDTATAEARAREALSLRSEADWPFNSLFDLQVSKGEWDKALETLALGEKRALIEGTNLKRRRAVLHTALATGLPHTEKAAAQKALAEAIRAAPDFPPAAWHGARFLQADGKTKAAQGVLERRTRDG
jgi:HemY protein